MSNNLSAVEHLSTEQPKKEQPLPQAISWWLVEKEHDPEKRAIVKAALLGEGYILIHTPLGSYYVNKENRAHPEYKLSDAWKEEQRIEVENKEKRLKLVADIKVFIATKTPRPDAGKAFINRILVTENCSEVWSSGQSLSVQTAIENFFISSYENNLQTYHDYREFCILSGFSFSGGFTNPAWQWAKDLFDQEQQAKRSEEERNRDLSAAIRNGNRAKAMAIAKEMLGASATPEQVKTYVNLIALQKFQLKSWIP